MDGWIEYRDDKLGFAIQCPGDVYLAKFKAGKGLILKKKESKSEIYEISVVPLTKEFEEIKDRPEWVKQITINGLVAKQRRYFYPDYGNILEVRVRVGKKIIQMVLTRADDKDAVKRFEKIVSTFRVIQ